MIFDELNVLGADSREIFMVINFLDFFFPSQEYHFSNNCVTAHTGRFFDGEILIASANVKGYMEIVFKNLKWNLRSWIGLPALSIFIVRDFTVTQCTEGYRNAFDSHVNTRVCTILMFEKTYKSFLCYKWAEVFTDTVIIIQSAWTNIFIRMDQSNLLNR